MQYLLGSHAALPPYAADPRTHRSPHAAVGTMHAGFSEFGYEDSPMKISHES